VVDMGDNGEIPDTVDRRGRHQAGRLARRDGERQ